MGDFKVNKNELMEKLFKINSEAYENAINNRHEQIALLEQYKNNEIDTEILNKKLSDLDIKMNNYLEVMSESELRLRQLKD